MSVPALGALLFFADTPLDMGVPPAASPILASPALPTSIPSDRATAQTPPAIVPPLASPEAIPAQPVVPKSVEAGPGHENGDIIVTARVRNVPGDPLQEFNFAAFQATQAVDQALVRPAALAYSNIVPLQIRLGIRNFLDHLTEPVVFVNFLLQHKIGKAVETFGRFVVNTTIGVVGLFDMAKRRPFKLPHRNNGFADTMGFYGVKTGPFLFLPLVGPTTARDLVGIVLDRLLVPLAAGRPFNRPAFSIPSALLGQLDQRDQFEEKMEELKGDGRGFYTASREDYLKQRQAQIDYLRGKGPNPDAPVSPVVKPEVK